MGMRTEGDSVHVVPGINGSCCYNCPGRETEARGEAVACIVACVGGKSPSWTPSLLPVLLEAADENRGIGTERAWVLILPCFSLVWGKTLFLSEPLFLYLYNGGTSPAACPRLKEGPKRCNSSNSWGAGQGKGEGAWHRVPNWNEGSCLWRPSQVRGLRTVDPATVTHKRSEVGTVTADPPCRKRPLSGKLECGSQAWLSHCQTTTVSHASSVCHWVPLPLTCGHA